MQYTMKAAADQMFLTLKASDRALYLACKWCQPAAFGTPGVSAQCTCWEADQPAPCGSPRCPAADAEDTPPGAYRIVA